MLNLLRATKSGLRSCPICGEEVLAEAVKCKHCGEFIEPASLDEKEACWLCRIVLGLVVVILILGVLGFVFQVNYLAGG